MTDITELLQMLSVLKQSAHSVDYIDGGSKDTLLVDVKADSAKYVLDEAIKTIEGLKLLVEWAVDCDFGYDNIPDEYERYKDELTSFGYVDGLMYIAIQEANQNRKNNL